MSNSFSFKNVDVTDKAEFSIDIWILFSLRTIPDILRELLDRMITFLYDLLIIFVLHRIQSILKKDLCVKPISVKVVSLY